MSYPFDQFVTFIYTHDLDDSAEFYGELLGLPLVLDQGPCRIFRVSANAFLGICTKTDAADAPPQPAGVILTLVSDDVDGWYNTLSARGVPIEKSPQLNPTFNIYHLFIRDPNGYLVEIQTFRDPTWPKE